MPSRVFTEGIGHTNETVSATVDSSGNLVMAKDIKLPAAGGIKDSSGNSLVTEAGGAVTLSDKVIPANSFMFRNKIINGNFDFWQRGTSQTSSGYGSADRWSIGHGTSSKTASQQSFANGQTDVPGNPKFYLRHVVTSSSGGYVVLTQNIEGVETLAGKTVTLSFYAKADSNKNIASAYTRYYGTGGSPSPSTFEDSIGVTTHNLTTSWQKFTTTVSIPSISGKTLGTNGNDYLHLVIWFDSGSTYSSRNNSLGQQSGTFDIAQVQLEEGSSATPFEHRPPGIELSLCQRYYYRLISEQIFTSFAIGRAFTTTNGTAVVFLPVPMRTSPPVLNFTAINNSGYTGAPWDYQLGSISLTTGQSKDNRTIGIQVTLAVSTSQSSWLLGTGNTSSYVFMDFTAEL